MNGTYYFIAGALSSRVMGILPTIVIAGVTIYFTDPKLITVDNVMVIKQSIIDVIKNITK